MRDQYAKPLEEKYKLVREGVEFKDISKENKAYLMNIINPLITYLQAQGSPQLTQSILKHIADLAVPSKPGSLSHQDPRWREEIGRDPYDPNYRARGLEI